MAERNVIYVEPGGEIEKLLQLVKDQPISVEAGGKRYRIEREKVDLFENYDPVKALAALRSLFGLYDNIDIEEFKREILEQREQDSIGRPAQ